jgi:hypothetical protein
MKKVLCLRIRLQDSYEICSEHLKVCQILFSGTADGDYFHGQILPGAVDTQRIYPDGSGTLSARYTICGEDYKGNRCLLFIENEAVLGTNETRPQIVTDSSALKWLTDADLCGYLRMEEENLIIDIYAK